MGLKAKLEKETDRTGSLSDSVSDYEKKLKELEGRMWDNLNKEAQRRTEAESKAKRLKKKVRQRKGEWGEGGRFLCLVFFFFLLFLISFFFFFFQ